MMRDICGNRIPRKDDIPTVDYALSGLKKR